MKIYHSFNGVHDEMTCISLLFGHRFTLVGELADHFAVEIRLSLATVKIC